MATARKIRISILTAIAISWSPLADEQLQAQLQAQPPAQSQGPSEAQQPDFLVFEIAMMPAMQKYVNLAEYPGILAVALENVGVELTSSARLLVRDRETLQFKNLVLHFRSRKGAVFHYVARIALPVGVADSILSLPVEIDAGPIANGRAVVRIHMLALAKLIPVNLTSRIGAKIRTLAPLSVQERLIRYLEDIAKTRPVGRDDVEVSLEQILLDHFNRTPLAGRVVAREPGDTAPLSDWGLFLITLFMGLLIVPSVYVGRKLWNGRRQDRA